MPPSRIGAGFRKRIAFLPPGWQRGGMLLLLCAVTFLLYPLRARVELGEWAFPLDDPWIHQVYARNLAEQGQYAFNPGEPSSGSSAPLWTLLMVPAHLLGLSPVLWAVALGLLSLAGLGAVVWDWADRQFPRPVPVLLTAAVVLSPHVGWAAMGGMETALVAALALLILQRLATKDWQGPADAFREGLLNGLLLWLRPEAPLLTLVVGWQRRRQGWGRLLAFGGGVAALYGPYAALHLALGGKPLPQTVYAKMAYYGQPPTLSSVAGFLHDVLLTFSPGVGPLLLLLLPLSLWRMNRRREWPWGPGLAWAGLSLLLAALRVPVVLHFGRHLVPLLPPLLLACGESLSALPALGRRAILLLGGCLLLVGMVVGASLYTPACQVMATSQVAMGRWIAAHLPPGVPLATHDIGAVGYFGQHPLVDTLALITPELTDAVAADDVDALWDYLQQNDVPYLVTLEGQYPEFRDRPGVERVTQQGRMDLLRLPW